MPRLVRLVRLATHDLVVGDADAGAYIEIRETVRTCSGDVAGLSRGRQGFDVTQVADRLLKGLEEAGDEEVLADFPAVAIAVPLDRMEVPDDRLIDLVCEGFLELVAYGGDSDIQSRRAKAGPCP